MKRLVFLDWLRIFSFASVLIGHKFYPIFYYLSQDVSVHESLRFIIQLVLPFCFAGGAGVVVFFLVSGYVITHVLQKEQPLEFFIKRVFRIYPLYITVVLLQYSLYHIPIDLHTLIPQLLLMGNFFDTPYTLNGVEWTLRVEILFYFFMFFLRYFKVIGKYEYLFPFALIGATLAMNYIPQLPSLAFANHGYLNIYAPFLFLGSFIWLYENKKVSLASTSAFTSLVFIQHWHMIDTILPQWQHSHFASLAFILFIAVWIMRDKLSCNRLILYVSELTYSVYLVHTWLLDYIKQLTIAGGLFQRNRYALALMFALCALLVKVVEKPGIKVGKRVLQFLTTFEFRIIRDRKVRV